MSKTNLIILIIVLVGLGFFFASSVREVTIVTNFEECVAEGNSVMESYPRQCKSKAGDTFTEEIPPLISKEDASKIAKSNKDCSMTGVVTHRDEEINYNPITKTWWFNLERMPELEKDGCNPACVVSEEEKTAEINWRCTGAKPINNIVCEENQRNVDICTLDYTPVCATVNVQCVTEPCHPVYETYGNSCQACSNPLVEFYIEGECTN